MDIKDIFIRVMKPLKIPDTSFTGLEVDTERLQCRIVDIPYLALLKRAAAYTPYLRSLVVGSTVTTFVSRALFVENVKCTFKVSIYLSGSITFELSSAMVSTSSGQKVLPSFTLARDVAQQVYDSFHDRW